MPRRLPLRPAKIIGNIFVSIVISYICTVYYYYIYYLWGPRMKNSMLAQLVVVFFHCLLFMLLWSFSQAMFTDPGQVPVFWGFHQGDSESKRRRYCLMCNVFKPERCHHCSACNRCVLNMDHHCPWINNCIGFWNRKHFLLLLFYVILTSYFIVLTMTYPLYQYLKENYSSFKTGLWNWREAWDVFCLLLIFSLDCFAAVLITMFTRFHIKIASENKTTIDSLEHKGRQFVSRFDCGAEFNWYQIFGTNKFLWPFPIFLDSGKPLGDGVYWNVNPAVRAEEQQQNVITESSAQDPNSKKNSIIEKQIKGENVNQNNENTVSQQMHQYQAYQQHEQERRQQPQIHQKDASNVLIVNQGTVQQQNKRMLANVVQQSNNNNNGQQNYQSKNQMQKLTQGSIQGKK